MGNADGMYHGLKERNDLGYLLRSNNVIFLDMEGTYNWTIH